MQAATPSPLVLSDFHTPGMDGAQLLTEIRARWPETAVVMLTAVSDVNLAVRCLDAGALDYLTKPFAIEELRRRAGSQFDPASVAACRSSRRRRRLPAVGNQGAGAELFHAQGGADGGNTNT